MTKFGFESEWEQGAVDLVSHLHRTTNYIRTAEPHRYHCTCLDCIIDTSQSEEELDDPDNFIIADLRAQRDSTCSGEIVSRPFLTMDEARPVFQAIEQGAVEVDAVPGLNSGWHVHVDITHLTPEERHRAFGIYVLWEQIVIGYAAGRWSYVRDMNTSVLNMLNPFLRDWRRQFENNGTLPLGSDDPAILPFLLLRADDNTRTSYLRSLHETHRGNDRHSYLSNRTRFSTWEFRLWNSTRSAWRMELWCEMSRLFTNMEFVNALMTFPYFEANTSTGWMYDRPSAHAFMLQTLSSLGHDRVAELLDRQEDYLITRAYDAPTELLVV